MKLLVVYGTSTGQTRKIAERLVHRLWPATLALGLVEWEPAMGWTGRSWLFPDAVTGGQYQYLTAALFALAAVAFTVAGVALMAQAPWSRALIWYAALLSAGLLLLFWDGNPQLLVEKGLMGVLLDAGILAVLLWTALR